MGDVCVCFTRKEEWYLQTKTKTWRDWGQVNGWGRQLLQEVRMAEGLALQRTWEARGLP